MLVTILLSHHKFTNADCKETYSGSKAQTGVKRVYTQTHTHTHTHTYIYIDIYLYLYRYRYIYIYINEKNFQKTMMSQKKTKKKKMQKIRRAEANGAIPARKHRRYCSNSCERGAAQVYNRKRVHRSSEGAVKNDEMVKKPPLSASVCKKKCREK